MMRVLDDWAPSARVPIYRLDQMMAEQQQVVFVGGGVIGVLTAFNLATQGQAVVLLERAGLGQESSWAGGGIVSPLYPCPSIEYAGIPWLTGGPTYLIHLRRFV